MSDPGDETSNWPDQLARMERQVTGHGRECADDCVHPSHRVKPAELFEDGGRPGEWVVLFGNGDRCEATVFSGYKAEDRAVSYAEHQYRFYL